MARRVYTQTELVRLINDDYTWRRKELQLIKSFIPTNSNSKQRAALRSSVPILYAHWEGFVKKSCELYLEFVAGKYLKHDELKSQFIVLSLSKKIGVLDVKNIEEKTKHVQFLLDEIDKKSNILTKNVIQTRSNLKYHVLREILFVVDIDESMFSSYESLINDLVDSRNNIAHGDYLRVEFETYLSMHNDIQVVMETLKTEIENSVILEKYRRTA